MVNADDLKSSGLWPCRFESCPGHHSDFVEIQIGLLAGFAADFADGVSHAADSRMSG